MPPRKKKIRAADGSERDGVEIPFQAGGENWNEYFLDDQTVLKMKTVVTEVLRVEGEYDNQGNPVYLVNSTNILTVSAPDNLMRKDEG